MSNTIGWSQGNQGQGSGGQGGGQGQPNNVVAMRPGQQGVGWLNNAGYDPDEFYTKATNAHDHAESISAKVRPDLKAIIERLVACGDYPQYTTTSDFVRDSLVHRAVYLTDRVSDPLFREKNQSILTQINMENVTWTMQQETQRWDDLMSGTRAEWTVRAKRGAWRDLLAACDSMEEHNETQRPSYRDEMRLLIAEYRAMVPENWEELENS